MTVGAIDSGLAYSAVLNGGIAHRDLSVGVEDLAIGQLIEVAVISEAGAGRYNVRIKGQERSADSATSLTSGSSVLAVVTGVGSRPELRALSAAEDPALAQTLATMASQFNVQLSAAAQRQLVIWAQAGDSLALFRAGLYLTKLNLAITAAALAEVEWAQQLPRQPVAITDGGSAPGLSLDPRVGLTAGASELAHLLEHAFAAPEPSDSSLNGGNGSDADVSHAFGDAGQQGGAYGRPNSDAQNPDETGARRALRQELLSLSDGGALQFGYATVPLIIGGKLHELDMALFQQRALIPAVDSPRRLVMSLVTSRLGAVRIVAQSLHSNLTVTLSSNDERAVGALTGAAPAMREQLASLGWQVNPIRLELTTAVNSAGRAIVDHVLTSGVLDRVL